MGYSEEELREYYSALPDEGGFDALCKMVLPGGLMDMKVLDLGCRRGKGIYKLSDKVYKKGRVIGVDWRPEFLEKAKAGEAHAAEKNGLAESNMEFICAYPEQLATCGVKPHSQDYIFVNSVLNVMLDPAEVLKQACCLLKKQGILVCQTVLASMPRDAQVVAEARKLGNVVQAAPHRKAFASWLLSAGFDMQSFETLDSVPVSANAGVDDETIAPTVQTDERVSFVATTITILPSGSFDYEEYITADVNDFR